MALKHLLALTIGLITAASPTATLQAQPGDSAEREFTLTVLPLLKQKCLGCHGGNQNDIKGDYQVTNRDHLLRGGESGDAAVVPGQPLEGTLLPALRWEGLEMPPKQNDRLTAQQIEAIRRWIKAGAPWPDEDTQAMFRKQARMAAVTDEGILVPTSGGTTEDWTNRRYQPEELWAFQPVRRMTAAEQQRLVNEFAAADVHNRGDSSGGVEARESRASSASSLIDALILRELRSNQIVPVNRADPRTLIRRATFDLHGMPPTPVEVEDFLKASQADPEKAWRQLIDRLLASPRYGERWARHWLDITRYADTGGMSNDYERSNMWRYRDYVIRYFNDDRPYDRFIVEQLAGDELADHSVAQRKGAALSLVHQTQLDGDYTSEEAEWIIATGYLRLGPWDNAMVTPEEARQIWLDDLVNLTGQTFLATTMRCVKCHDHKFDPIPTRDYYRMYAAFSTTHMAERPVPFLATENREGFVSGKAHVERMLDFAVGEKNRLIEKREMAARAWFSERNLPYRDEQDRRSLPDDQKPPRHVGLDHVDEGQLKVREQDEWIWNRRLERYQPMAQSVYNAAVTPLAWNAARKLRIQRTGNASPPVTHILTGGALTAAGEPVTPGVLSAISVTADPAGPDPYQLTDSIDNRRLGLARWIADPENPLTTRSIVNRIWQYHFGTGLAANANNFGAKGAKPSHPELLDYLAADFVEHGWTFKRMHRLIMMTATYQRSSVPVADNWRAVDPDNRLLSHYPRRRLTAEEIRDGILSLTGELVDRRGGVPVMPEINMEVALQPRMIQFSLAPAYQPSPTPNERNARSIYTYHVRGQPDPFMEIFNQPGPNESCEMRETAAVTPQAFTLLNSDLMTDRSIALALKLQKHSERPDEQIQLAFQSAFSRPATQSELDRLTAYLDDMVTYHHSVPAVTVTYPTDITRSLVEEFSGKVFTYREILPVFENYVSDRKPADVAPRTRALADLCLLLFNANEFMYVN